MARSISANETDLWLIPKRGSIHQIWCLIDGIIERKADGRSWGPNMQNNLGVNLKNWGATRDGKNISPQAIRTLTAFAQYLGFLYIDGSSTPSVIRITTAGYKFWNDHKSSMLHIRNLSLDANLEMKTSDCVKLQMEKLQLTNPLQLKKCTDILLFPFRMTLKFVSELNYLDSQELAIFLFPMRSESDYKFVLLNIQKFRQMTVEDREQYVDAYKKTKLGNITLVQAPSAGYYATLCERTDLIETGREYPLNWTSSKLCTIRIKPGKEKYVNTILNQTYFEIKPYDFGDDVRLWIEYYGDPKRIHTPTDAIVRNMSGEEVFITVADKSNNVLVSEIVGDKADLLFPAFPEADYVLSVFSNSAGKFLKDIVITPSQINYTYTISNSVSTATRKKSFGDIKEDIIDHINAQNFTVETTKLLNAIKNVNGVDKTADSSLRGAFLEFYFYRLLCCLKEANHIDDVIWNGRIGQYGLPNAAPGGKIGKCDITFFIDSTQYVLELTTIKSKSGQEKAEATAVPDHIRIAAASHSGKTVGIYSAPLLHSRVTGMMKATATSYGIDIKCIDIISLLNLLSAKSRKDLIDNLNK